MFLSDIFIFHNFGKHSSLWCIQTWNRGQYSCRQIIAFHISQVCSFLNVTLICRHWLVALYLHHCITNHFQCNFVGCGKCNTKYTNTKTIQLSYCVKVWYFGGRRCRFRMAQCVNNFVPEKEMSAIPFQFCSMLCYPFRVATAPVLESMRAREPGLQAPSNLAGSKIKNTHFSPLLILSQRYPILVKEPIM